MTDKREDKVCPKCGATLMHGKIVKMKEDVTMLAGLSEDAWKGPSEPGWFCFCGFVEKESDAIKH